MGLGNTVCVCVYIYIYNKSSFDLVDVKKSNEIKLII